MIWALKALSGLFLSFVICYALIWILFEFLWLSIPVWIGCYLIARKLGMETFLHI